MSSGRSRTSVGSTVKTGAAHTLTVDQSLEHLDLYTRSQYPSPDFELSSFWVMLARHAPFKEADAFTDSRVFPAEIAAADHLYETFYVPSDEAITYSNLNLESGGGAHASTDLSAEYAAWLLQIYQKSGLTRFRDRAYILFERGVRDAYLGGFDGNGRSEVRSSGGKFTGSALICSVISATGPPRGELHNFIDLVAVSQSYNTKQFGAVFSEGYFNYDDKVDFDDLVILPKTTILPCPRPPQFRLPAGDRHTKACQPRCDRETR